MDELPSLRIQKYFPYAGRYLVSRIGFVKMNGSYNGGIDGVFILPNLRNGKIHYHIFNEGRHVAERRMLVNIMEEALGLVFHEPAPEVYQQMREMVIAENARLGQEQGKKAKAGLSGKKNAFCPFTWLMPDQFPVLDTLPPEQVSWYSAQMMPLT